MKAILKTIAAVAMFAFAAPAFAGGVTVDNDGTSKLKLEGLIYADLTSYKSTNNAGLDTKVQSARVERAYFTGKYYFNDDWMMRITTDVSLNSALNAAGKNNNIFLKYAYLEGKLAGDAVVLRLGQSHTPWIDYEQGLWGHRYHSKVMIDSNGYDASSDVGVGLKGKLADGKLGYFVTLTNGAGYSHIDRTGNSMDFDARVGVYPIKGLTLDVQYRNGYKGLKTFINGVQTTPTKHTLYQVMATYGMGKDFRVGANYAQNKATTAGVSVKDKAYGIWAWGKFAGDFGAFGRFESTKNDAAAVVKHTHTAVGVEYFPVKHVTLALGLDNTKTTTAGAQTGKTTRYGLWSETKF